MITKALRAAFKAVMDEASQNPAFERRLEEALVDVEEIDKALGIIFKETMDEAAQNAAFARKIQEALGKFADGYMERRKAEKKIAGFHPFIEYKKSTPEAFVAALQPFEVVELKMIVERHGLDPAKTLKGKSSRRALVDLIVSAAKKRAERDAKLFEY
ncbi:MAG: hypothetical protein R3C52_02395 [Hyphomonadaceae bacterium]